MVLQKVVVGARERAVATRTFWDSLLCFVAHITICLISSFSCRG